MGCGSSKVVPAGEAAIVLELDNTVIAALANGTVRLVSVSYLLAQPDGFRLARQQELLQVKGALLSPKKAAALMREENRRVFALSYGWLSADNPDPHGKRFQAVLRALRWLKSQRLLRGDEGLFWDFGSLPQKPRTAPEDAAFKEGLRVMANMYASALGTSVLQLREVPVRPKQDVGAMRACRLPAGFATEKAIRNAYQRFGEIVAVEVRADDEVTVRFKSREAVLKALNFDMKALGFGMDAFVCHEYNDRAYADRGWCSFEDAVSIEFLGRSRKEGNAMMKQLMDRPQRAKVYAVSSGADPAPVVPSGPQDKNVVKKRVESATFIGRGDRKVVLDMYNRFQLDGAQIAAKLQHLTKPGGNAGNVSARQMLAAETAANRVRFSRGSAQ